VAKKIQTQLWLSSSTHAALKKVAAREGVSMTQLADDILTQYLPQRDADAIDRLKRIAQLAGRTA
jgi:hypothetical protein